MSNTFHVVTTLLMIFQGCSRTCGTCRHLETEVKSLFLADFVKKYHCSCVFLSYSPRSHTSGRTLWKELQLVEAFRMLHSSWMPVSTTSDVTSITCNRGAALVVIPNAADEAWLNRLSRSERFCSTKWLLFRNESNNLEKNFTKIFLPFNCNFYIVKTGGTDIEINEVYRVDESSPLMTSQLGTWNAEQGLHVSNSHLYSRRASLGGHSFQVVSFISGNMHLSEKVMKILTDVSNSTYNMVAYPQQIPGYEDENQTWNGLIGMLQQGSAEIILDLLTLTADRFRVADFSRTVYHDRILLFIKNNMAVGRSWWIMMSPFSWNLWLAVTTVVILLTFCSFLMRHIAKRQTTQITPMMLVTSPGVEESRARPASLRVLRLCASLVLVTAHVAYCARVVSITAVTRLQLPFAGIEGVQAAGYSVIIAPGTSTEEYFKAWSARALEEGRGPPPARHAPPVLSTTEALARLCATPAACLLEQAYTVSCSPRPCTVLQAPTAVAAVQLGYLLSKRSPYTGVISYQIAKLSESGILKRLKSTTCKRVESADDQDFRTVDMSHVALVFLIFYIMSVISFLIMLYERAMHAYAMKKKSHI